jgi:excisionase family DNA binding protein
MAAPVPEPFKKPRPASRLAQPFARPLDPLLTVKQTAALLQVSEKTIRRRIAEGGLVAHRIGAQWRIASRDVADYLRDRRVP